MVLEVKTDGHWAGVTIKILQAIIQTYSFKFWKVLALLFTIFAVNKYGQFILITYLRLRDLRFSQRHCSRLQCSYLSLWFINLSYILVFQFPHRANWMLTTQNITVTVEIPLTIITEWPKRPSNNNVNNKVPYINYCAVMVMKKLQIPVHRRCCRVHYTTSCKHSLVLLRMGKIIARNMLSWLKLLITVYLSN